MEQHLHYYSFNIGDYTSHTAHLTPIEDIAYRRLLDIYYQTEAPIANDIKAICRQIRMREHETDVQQVLTEFFTLGDAGWFSARCDREIQEYKAKADTARANGKRGGRPPKKQTQSENNQAGYSGFDSDNPDQTNAKANHKPLTNNQEPIYEEAKASLSTAKLPTCPHLAIIDLFAKHLPELPQPKAELWDGARAKNLAARWKWVLTEKRRSTGTPHAGNKEEALAWFDRFFGYVAQSDFLTGRDGKWQNCDLAWLTKADNFAKVLQGNYENKS